MRKIFRILTWLLFKTLIIDINLVPDSNFFTNNGILFKDDKFDLSKYDGISYIDVKFSFDYNLSIKFLIYFLFILVIIILFLKF